MSKKVIMLVDEDEEHLSDLLLFDFEMEDYKIKEQLRMIPTKKLAKWSDIFELLNYLCIDILEERIIK